MSGSGFSGFPQDGLAFLRELSENNERAWFQANRDRYEAGVQAPMRALVADLVTRFAGAKIPLTADPMKATFRIHRDVRFSNDKSPYKTHAGAVLNRDGTKGTSGLLYLHVDPKGSFAAAGFYQPDPRQLSAIRGAIAAKPKMFQAVLDGLREADLDLSPEDSLTRMPRGLEAMAESPLARYLRLRHFIARAPLEPDVLTSDALPARVFEFARLCQPLLRFGWAAIG